MQTAMPAHAHFTDAVSQILHNGSYPPGNVVTYTNTQLGFGTTTRQVTVIVQPSIAEVEAGALTAALAAKAPQSEPDTKTEVQGFLTTKANAGDLLQLNTSGSTYQTISHLAINSASVSMTGSSATVTADPP